jgi:hypothetical protein
VGDEEEGTVGGFVWALLSVLLVVLTMFLDDEE